MNVDGGVEKQQNISPSYLTFLSGILYVITVQQTPVRSTVNTADTLSRRIMMEVGHAGQQRSEGLQIETSQRQ